VRRVSVHDECDRALNVLEQRRQELDEAIRGERAFVSAEP
jgi:hypothetical protein